ncbi:MAG: TM2 domain-containing protein [Caldilineaceae bacterium]|nr:TM2 domain-containing protein [Caldilineaceae bacterium]
MSTDTRKLMQFEANKKSVGVAYLLWFFFGGLGAHRFYLGRSGSGAVILILTLLSLVLMLFYIGFFTIIIPGIWVFIDVFLIPGMARSYNSELANRLSM